MAEQKEERRYAMTEKRCGNCYWWDAAEAVWARGYRGLKGYHRCRNAAAAKGALSVAFATQPDHSCLHFRAASPDDPATLWNRKHPGHKKRKPKDPEAQKRGKASKRKGKRVEKLCGEFFTKLMGGEAIVRHGNRDVQFVGNGLEHYQIEAKGRAAFSFIKHCKQAEQDAATHGLPRWLVWAKADREQPYIITDATDYAKDMAELRDLRTIVDGLAFAKEVEDEDAESGI